VVRPIRRSEFRPVPRSLVRLRQRARYREYARFYGNYTSMTGKRKRFSFSVRISPRLSNRAKYEFMVETCNALKDRMVPEHTLGEVFSSFGELLDRTVWFRIRRLRNYKAGVIYED